MRFFNDRNRLKSLDGECLPVYKEGTFSIAVLDGANYLDGGKGRFASVIRLVRRNGLILLVTADGGLDPEVLGHASGGQHTGFQSVGAWKLRVTAPLLAWAWEQEGGCTETEGLAGTLLELWGQVDGALSGLAETDLGRAGREGLERDLLGCIAALHDMEDTVIALTTSWMTWI